MMLSQIQPPRSQNEMIFLLGGRGYVGKAYQQFLTRKGLAFKTISREATDYSEVDVLSRVLEREKPQFLINAAGYTGKPNVDACEFDKAECLFGNAVLPGRIAEACRNAGIPWGHVSSGCIYTGCKADGSGFTEKDPPNFSFRTDNCSFYSGTKALGEEVLAGDENVYIWRLRIPFNQDDGARNYLTKLMRYDTLLQATNSISQLDEFVEASYACWEQRVPFGIYNVTNPGAVSTRGVVELIEQSGVCKKQFKFFDSEQEFMKTAAITPRSNCVLECSKLEAVGIRMRPAVESLELALANWRTTSES